MMGFSGMVWQGYWQEGLLLLQLLQVLQPQLPVQHPLLLVQAQLLQALPQLVHQHPLLQQPVQVPVAVPQQVLLLRYNYERRLN